VKTRVQHKVLNIHVTRKLILSLKKLFQHQIIQTNKIKNTFPDLEFNRNQPKKNTHIDKYTFIQGYIKGTVPTVTRQCWPDWKKFFNSI
jgi:hypothetical protein